MAEQREAEQETPRAAAAYHEYCELGPGRSLRKLAESNQKYSKSIALLMRWSTRYHWVERARQYDAEVAAERLRKREEAIDAMNERQWTLARQGLELAHARILELMAAGKFGALAAVQYAKNSAELERLARGAATERAERTGQAETVIICETQWGTERLPTPQATPAASTSTSGDTELVMRATFGSSEEE